MKRGGGRFWKTALICGLLFFGGAVATNGSEDPSAKLEARFVPGAAKVGSIVVLTLSYRLPEGAHLPMAPQIQGLDGLTIEGIQKEPEEVRIRLLVDGLGPFKTGPLSLAYLDKEGKKKFLHTDPVQLTVLSNLGERPEDAQLKPIYGIIPTRSGLTQYLMWVAIGLAVCVAGIALFLWSKRRYNTQDRLPSRVPPHTLAEKEIYALESRGLFEKGRVKEFYFSFSEIMRRYLESLRGFPAAEYTTQEIALHIQDAQDREILPLLKDADLVKFADLTPTSAKKDDEIGKALAYIHETGAAFESDASGYGVAGKTIGRPQQGMKKIEEMER
ncbi:MAG: hypothetical protein JRL30_02940 [Deltaproteobacteria bacterium]|nr:hypothetical protein [Deltaproteobacteria bacterium]